jgi:hypothetical protein
VALCGPAPRGTETVLPAEKCFRRLLGLCFVVPPDSNKGGIFGFAEFVQAFALLVLIFRRHFRQDEYPLRKAVISFARKNYLALVQRQDKVAAAVLMGTISFDEEKKQLVKTYMEGLDLVAPTDTLDLIEPKPATASV